VKACFNTITCGGDKPLETVLDLLGKYGFEGVEIEAGRLDDYLTRYSVSDLRRQLARNRLQVAAIMAFPFFAFDAAQQEEQLRRVDKYARLARQLGSSTLLCFTADAPPAGMGIAEALERAGKAAQRYGEASGQYAVKCALEPIGGAPFMPGPRQALAVVGASMSKSVGIMMDTFHSYKSGVPLDEIRRLPREQLLIVHVNDCPDLPREQLHDGHRVYPGQGVIPLVEEFRLLKHEVGYRGFLSIEIFNRDYWADSPENVVRQAKLALDAVLAKV